MARYIDRNLQIHIPPDLIRRIQDAPDKVRACVQIAGELIAALKEKGGHGVLISTIGWEDKLPGILAAAGV
jgi:5,10-methylenetetrahydrofolate reductase